MGKGFFSQCFNLYGEQFAGTDVTSNCMYDLNNLNPLPNGYGSQYIEFKQSGTCWFAADPSYVVEGYGLGDGYNFFLALCSKDASFSFDPPWAVQTLTDDDDTCYIGTLPGGIQVSLDSFAKCGKQQCIGWTIYAPGGTDAEKQKAVKAATILRFPKDGSDYRGPSS